MNTWTEIRRNPFGFLGVQETPQGLELRVLNHAAIAVFYVPPKGEPISLTKGQDAIFRCPLTKREPYTLCYVYPSTTVNSSDPYSFPPVADEYDIYLFSEGTHRKPWLFMGAHPRNHAGVDGVSFTVWAPEAQSVRVAGNFNGWDKERHFLRPRGASGIWEIFIPHIGEDELYKFFIETKEGALLEKSDPYAYYAEKRPQTASIVYRHKDFDWNDAEWMDKRTRCYDEPLSVYEVHLSSWIRDEHNNILSYKDLAYPLAEYIKDHGFTHVEFMPISEYPFDGSWGYQVTGYFAPTSRYGTPDDLKYLIEYLHQQNIGVIVDWVPAHFPADAHGLARFDGSALYEHLDSRLGWHHDWSTYIFNYGRNEVRQFLIGSALYWLDCFHVDGLRVDAVASMLYLDYSREEGEWLPNKYGGRENLEAIEFLQSLQAEVNRYHPTAMTIAEESTSFSKVTVATDHGGLGFTYKWNMGWMNDTLDYFMHPPIFRKWHHNEITFSLVYAFSENYILPFSHDEVVHGKGTLVSRMPGGEWEQMANLRLMLAYQWCHPGKKLLFAGQEFAPWEEWAEDRSIDWHLNAHPLHMGMRLLVRDLNFLYRDEPALHRCDCDPITFEWVDVDNNESGLLQFIRRDRDGNTVAIICNLNTLVHKDYRVGVPQAGFWKEIFNTDSSRYGGANIGNLGGRDAHNQPWQGKPASMCIDIGPLAVVVFKYQS
ncbi:MAG: 1,4-alpha-glucan branching protein GlgB [Brevinema sp.]